MIRRTIGITMVICGMLILAAIGIFQTRKVGALRSELSQLRTIANQAVQDRESCYTHQATQRGP